MSHPATILDIARVAKVSPSTVSRALRKETSHLVHPDKMKRIFEVMDELHYSPSRLARGLRYNLTHTVNLVVSYSPDAYKTEIVPRLIAGISEVLVESGYELKLCMLKPDAPPMNLREYFTDADGLIYAAHSLTPEDMDFLESRAKNCVVLDDCIPIDFPVKKCPFSTVGITNEDGACEVVKHLIELGHRKIAIVKGPSASRDSNERYEGYLRAMREAGLPVEDRWVLSGDFMEGSGRTMIRFIHSDLPEVTACFFASDDMAVGAIDEAEAIGLNVPADFSIAGYDNVRLARFCSPKLTTVEQPREKIGNTAARCLLNQIQSDSFKILHVRIPHQLHVRESTTVPGKQ